MSDTTPPNWPIYNVSLTGDQISDIVGKVHTGSKVNTITHLGKKKSFNNRIYFLNIAHPSSENDLPQEVVVKVNGRFFGECKIRNEVSCLLLLQQYCPDIPAPRVVAWSEDGAEMCAVRNGAIAILHDEVIEPEGVSVQPPTSGWIMTTKRPGRILQRDELSLSQDSLIQELAGIMASWRTDIPHRDSIGNLTFQPAEYTTSTALYGLEILTSGLILCDKQPSFPVGSSIAYYTHLLSDQMNKIDSNDVFAYSRSRILTRLEYFRDSVLPHLIGPQNDQSCFTQQDFAPRNVLVEESDDGSLRVSGIVDFEFAGFFPYAEEFLTCRARQSDDWPEDFFESLCSALTSRGLEIPGYNASKEEFDILRDLAVLTENVAPWWLQDGHITGQSLEDNLAEACEVVEGVIEKLSKR